MKYIATFLLIMITSNVYSVTMEFVGPCEAKPFLIVNVDLTQNKSVGDLTVSTLQESGLDFKGTEAGINQILNSPIGLDSLEVINQNEMMAYGWCYEVDGVITESYPNEISAAGIKRIRWFYGYAHYKDGEWVAQCLKSYLRKSPFICTYQ